MIIAYCDKCNEKLDSIWRINIIKSKFSDDSGSILGEICDKCIKELKHFLHPKTICMCGSDHRSGETHCGKCVKPELGISKHIKNTIEHPKKI